LAQRIGVSVWRIWRIENQISPMRMSEREALLRALPLLAKLDEREREHDGA
jgi:hypothetical protein